MIVILQTMFVAAPIIVLAWLWFNMIRPSLEFMFRVRAKKSNLLAIEKFVNFSFDLRSLIFTRIGVLLC